MQTSDLYVNNAESDYDQFQDAIFSREYTSVTTLTKIILQWQEIVTLSLPKKSCHRSIHLNNILRAFLPQSQ